MLRQGMRLSQKEFRVRYEKSDLRKVELVKSKVRMPSSVNFVFHAAPHSELTGWLYAYEFCSPSVDVAIDASVKLDSRNELQPDVLMRKKDGACNVDENGYLCGPPELVVEISNTSSHFDSHEKKDIYEMCRVKEYIVWRTKENQVDWFVLRNERYQKIGTVDGVITSETFPGLALNVAALLEGNSSEVIQTLRNAINER